MATDEANSSEDKFKSTLIQAFCKERVESMAHFLEQIMVRQYLQYTSMVQIWRFFYSQIGSFSVSKAIYVRKTTD